jgi:hypothetical protein
VVAVSSFYSPPQTWADPSIKKIIIFSPGYSYRN